MKNSINIMLVLAAIAALVVTAVELRRWSVSAKASRGALAAVLEKNAALKAQIAGLKSTAPASPQNDSTEAEAKNEARKKQAAGQQAQLKKQDAAHMKAYSKSLMERKANDREFSLKYYAAMRQAVDVQYGPFYRLQHLTKEQTDALAEALFQRQLRSDKMNDDRKAGGSAADAKTAKAGADAEFAAAAQETLGEDLYGQLTLYERQRGAWDFVGSFASMLSLADMPLSLEQSAQMADAIANANSSFQKDGTIKSTMGGGTDWDAVDVAAAKFLTPAQLEFLKNVSVGSSGGTLGFGASRQMEEFSQAIQNLPSE